MARTFLSRNPVRVREEHVAVWSDLFKTGMSISYSYADGALNGDRINSTLYHVLSQVWYYRIIMLSQRDLRRYRRRS